MTRTFDFSQLGQWPRQPIDQQRFIERMKTLLEQAVDYFDDEAAKVITLSQAYEPVQAQWEAAWTVQTGQILPILPNARLLWWKTDSDEFGGEYGTVIGDATVYRRENLYPLGSTVLMQTDFAPLTETTMDWQIGDPTHYTDLPAFTAILPVQCDLEVMLRMEATLASGSGDWGVDFMMDGVKIGTQDLSIPATYGFSGINGTGEFALRYPIAGVAAGSHTFQMLAGYVGAPGTPPTFTISVGDGAFPQMYVRAIAS